MKANDKPGGERFDALLRAMLAGPAPSARKGGEQPQRTQERKPVEKQG